MRAEIPAEFGRKRDHPGTRAHRPADHELAYHGSNDAIREATGQHLGPLAHGLGRAADKAPTRRSGAAEQRDGGGFLHGARDLTLSTAAKQTRREPARKPKAGATSADVRRRPLASAVRLIDRIDKAMKEAGLKQIALAERMGITSQTFTNMRRKPNGGMHHELLGRAAKVLGCDLYWLCTGEGGEYVPAVQAESKLSRFAREVAQWVNAMPRGEQLKAWAVMNQVKQGYWPVTYEGDDEATPPGR